MNYKTLVINLSLKTHVVLYQFLPDISEVTYIKKQLEYGRNNCKTICEVGWGGKTVEPFIGGGAVIFWILQEHPNIERAIINDINAELVCTYRVVKQDVMSLIEELGKIL